MAEKKKYRMLAAGETVKITDQVYVGDPINRWLTGSLNVGKKLPAGYIGKYRRLVLKKEAVIDKPLCKKYDGCNYAIKQYCGGFDSSAVSQLGCYRI